MARQRIGRYDILESVGTGGFANVYRARDTQLGREVALKVLHPHMAGDPEYLERFLREARLAASINDPNVVTVHEVGQEGNTHFIAMEYLPSSLEGMALGDRLPVPVALVLTRQVALGLRAAHQRGVVHRDLKPANILLTPDGTPKVTDFGIARAAELSNMTASGLILGTPNYMSPEQAQGRPVDARSDIYSLGCVLYQMLTGALPFEATTPWEVIRQHIEATPRPVRQLYGDIPAEVEQLVNRCLAKNPNQRYQSAGELAQALASLQETVPQTAGPVGAGVGTAGATMVGTPSRSSTGRRLGQPWMLVAIGGVALLAAVGTLVGLAAAGSGKGVQSPVSVPPNGSNNEPLAVVIPTPTPTRLPQTTQPTNTAVATAVPLLTATPIAATAAPQVTAQPAPTSPPEHRAVPTAVPAATSAPPVSIKPNGTINVGLKELGPFGVHPSVITSPQLFTQSTAPIGEGLLMQDSDRDILGLLADSWSISPDFLTWTFNLQRGVQFHKGYGEMFSEDVLWSMQQYTTSKHPRAGQLATFYEDRSGTSTPNPYTVVVNTGAPVVDLVAMDWHMTPGGRSSFIVSKKQTDELGVEAASRQIAATGPWEIMEHRTGEFWRMAAVENHWRQTPEFAELLFWEIPEEASRIAGFQTGQLDTFQMSFDSIPLVERVEGARLISVPNAIEQCLRFYGNWYPIPGLETRPGYDPDLPWVSASADLESPAWEQALKVRRALMMAIDRQAILDTIISGYGHLNTPLGGYSGFENYLGGRDWPQHSAEGAKGLLAEAGYPDGFSITLTPAIRGAPAEVEVCEAVAQMWNDIGVDVKFQRVPYGTLRPQLVARTYQGATCHGGSPLSTPSNGYGSYISQNPFNRGLEHIYLERKMIEAMGEADPTKPKTLESEIGAFILDNALTDLNLYNMDAVWPVGPRLLEWTEHVKTTDVRQMNGYEYIRHR